jgi:hypothetical protein
MDTEIIGHSQRVKCNRLCSIRSTKSENETTQLLTYYKAIIIKMVRKVKITVKTLVEEETSTSMKQNREPISRPK